MRLLKLQSYYCRIGGSSSQVLNTGLGESQQLVSWETYSMPHTPEGYTGNEKGTFIFQTMLYNSERTKIK